MNSGLVLLLMAGGGALFLFLLWLGLSITRGGGRATGPTWRPDLGGTGTPDRPFTPTVSGPGLAIDAEHDWLWVATEENGYRFIEKSHIRTWRLEWTERSHTSGATQLWHNKLVLGLSDLRTPIVKVGFGRDHALAQEWQARLSAWLNG